VEESKNYRIHRLVASAFIPNPEELPQVNHKDGNRLNNRVDNLEWASAKDNMRHAGENGLRGKRRYNYEPSQHPTLVKAQEMLDSGYSVETVTRKLKICKNTLKKYAVKRRVINSNLVNGSTG
jgi:hypothetical protein